MANPPITDPLADWPKVDPHESDLRAWASDLKTRAQELDTAAHTMASASNGSSLADWSLSWTGSAAAAARAKWADLAVATLGASTAVGQVSTALTNYADAFDTYNAAMKTAHATASKAMSDEETEYATYAAAHPQTTVSKADLELGDIGPYYVPPASPNRALAKTQANAALDDFKNAGLVAGEAVMSAAWTMEPGSIDSKDACTAPVSSVDSLLATGRVMLKGALKGKGAYADFNKGRNIFDLALVRNGSEALRDFNQVKTAQEIAFLISFGHQGEDAAKNLSLAAPALAKLGASDEMLASLGKAVGYAGPPLAMLGDVLTIAGSNNGETGVHNIVTKTAAGVNFAATGTMAGLALADIEVPGLDVVTAVAALGTAIYQVGDWVYDEHTAIWHWLTGYQKPLVMP